MREMLILKRRLKRQLAGMAVSPLLYLIAFGYAMGDLVRFDGHTYLEFLIPGLVAMSSMTQSFGIATDINVARFYWYIFEEFQAAPISNSAYVAGEVAAGMTRGILSVSVILALSLPFGVILHYGPLFWVAVLLNSFVFSALAVALAMLVKSHADQSLVTGFVITPMAFFGRHLFPGGKASLMVPDPFEGIAPYPCLRGHSGRCLGENAGSHGFFRAGHNRGCFFYFGAFVCQPSQGLMSVHPEMAPFGPGLCYRNFKILKI